MASGSSILMIGSFVVGAVGNIAALWILYKSARKRNKKHVLLLRCLAMNDLLAQLGMLLMIQLKKYDLVPCYWICVGFVIVRAFGLGSGCVAFVMALERWLALTRPFLYHQLVTYQSLKRFIFCLWFINILLTYLPFVGFGLYYTENKCLKLRYATELKDVIYAYVFFIFGASLCICITFFNSMVVWELLRIKTQNRVLVRRISRSIINNRVGYTQYQTPEEVAFAKLMAFVCIVFVLCWTPQVMTVPLVQLNSSSAFVGPFSKLADLLLCVYFTVDPFVYVLQRYIERGKLFEFCGFSRRSTPNTPATTTTMGTPTSVLIHPPSFTVP